MGVDNCSGLWKPHSRVTTEETRVDGTKGGVWTTIRGVSTLPERFSTDGYVGALEGASGFIPESYPYYGDDFF